MKGAEDHADQLARLNAKLDQVFEGYDKDGSIAPNQKLGHGLSNMIRIQRALSWLQRGSFNEEEDQDVSFVFHWIAFESLFGKEKNLPYQKNLPHKSNRSELPSVSDQIMEFLVDIEKIEDDRVKLKEAVRAMRKEVAELMNNPYINPLCWRTYYTTSGAKAGRNRNPFQTSGKKWRLGDAQLNDTVQFNDILKDLFHRIYLLRNQLLHGNASYKGRQKTERAGQVKNGAALMRRLIPELVEIMLGDLKENPEMEKWGIIPYPRFKDAADNRGRHGKGSAGRRK